MELHLPTCFRLLLIGWVGVDIDPSRGFPGSLAALEAFTKRYLENEKGSLAR